MTGEEDLRERVTKKVKSRENEGAAGGVDVAMEESSPVSFREALMNVPGMNGDDETIEFEWDDANMPENRWYREEEELPKEKSHVDGAIPEITVSDEELMEWSKQWRLTLVVHVLGKKVNYRMLENKIKRDWARTGGV